MWTGSFHTATFRYFAGHLMFKQTRFLYSGILLCLFICSLLFYYSISKIYMYQIWKQSHLDIHYTKYNFGLSSKWEIIASVKHCSLCCDWAIHTHLITPWSAASATQAQHKGLVTIWLTGSVRSNQYVSSVNFFIIYRVFI